MSKFSKRISSIVLTIALILTMIPMAASIAFADEEPAAAKTVLAPVIDDDPELVQNYIIVAPGALWTISKAAYDGNFDISQGCRYLNLNDADLNSGSKTENGLHIDIDEDGNAKIYQYSDMKFFGAPYFAYRYLTPDLGQGCEVPQGKVLSFGYLFTPGGNLVKSVDDITDGGEYYIVSRDLKCLRVDNFFGWHASSWDFKLFDQIENAYEVKEAVYNRGYQEILTFDKELLNVRVSGDAFVKNGAVYAKTAGEYTIKISPKFGIFWSDWTTEEVVINTSIAPKTEHNVTAASGDTYQVILPELKTVFEDEDYYFDVLVQSGYEIVSVSAENGTVTHVEGTQYKLSGVTGDVQITVVTQLASRTVYVDSSSPKTYALTVDAEGGTYTPQTKKYTAGEKVEIRYAAKKGYEYYGCAVCTSKTLVGLPYKDEDGVLSFTMPKEAVDVTLYFVEEEVTDALARFVDVEGIKYIDAVRYCVEHGYADGTSATTFEPNRAITKSEVLGMIWKFAGRLYPDYAYRYKDVMEGKWFTSPVRWGAAEKVVSDEMEYFLPSTPAQRQIIAVMFYQYLQTKGEGFSGLWMYKLSAPDADQVASWALEAVTYLNMISVMQGDEKGNLKPEALMTRAEMCELIYKYDTLADEF